jgi:hypothetical protein
MKFKKILLHTLFLCLLNFISFSPAQAAPLSDPQTGLSLNAAPGFTLSSNDGIYTLKNKNVYALFIYARSPLPLKETADSFVKLSKIKNVTKKTKKSSIEISGKLNGKVVKISFTSKGNLIDIVQSGQVGKIKAKSLSIDSKPRVLRATDLNQLLAALKTRQGGTSIPLQLNIPTKTFTAADGTSATVPNLPGWNYNGGGGGILSGSAAGQGVFEFGVPAVVGVPPFGGVIVNRFVDAGTAIGEVWPKYNAVYTGAQVVVTGGALVAGTEGFLAPDFLSSGMFAISFTINGEAWVGLMTSGTTPLPGAEAISYIWYHSFIAVPVNGPGGIGPALINAWTTWNHSAADAARLAQAAATLASIRVEGAGPIDPDVFQAKANAWDEYIRGPE